MKIFLILSNLILLVPYYFKRLFLQLVVSLLFRHVKQIVKNNQKDLKIRKKCQK